MWVGSGAHEVAVSTVALLGGRRPDFVHVEQRLRELPGLQRGPVGRIPERRRVLEVVARGGRGGDGQRGVRAGRDPQQLAAQAGVGIKEALGAVVVAVAARREDHLGGGGSLRRVDELPHRAQPRAAAALLLLPRDGAPQEVLRHPTQAAPAHRGRA